MMKTEPTSIGIVLTLYRGLISQKQGTGIPVKLRPKSTVGTVQDDPFDWWIMDKMKKIFPETMEIIHSGSLTTPDIVIRDRTTGKIVGLEIKKLIMSSKGKDPRGLTLDYNSCLPCGRTFVKVGEDTVVIPCFYLFALLDSSSTNIVTLIILDGDFLNYDLDLHREAKYSNYSEYNHGPYGEGSVRHRKMYTYPNPLNSKISSFNMKHVLVAKKTDLLGVVPNESIKEQIIRTDKYGNSFYYYLVDEVEKHRKDGTVLSTLENIFDECKHRERKERVAYMPSLPPLDE